jgi:hypothetical protein
VFDYNVTSPSIEDSGSSNHDVARIWKHEDKARWAGQGTIIPTPSGTAGPGTMTSFLDQHLPHNSMLNWLHKLLAKREAHHTLPSFAESCDDNSGVCGDDKFLRINASSTQEDYRVRKLPKASYTIDLSSSKCDEVCSHAFYELFEEDAIAFCDIAEVGKFSPWGNRDSKCKEFGYNFSSFAKLETAQHFMKAKLKKTMLWAGLIGLSILLGLVAAAAYGVISCCKRCRSGRSEEYESKLFNHGIAFIGD